MKTLLYLLAFASVVPAVAAQPPMVSGHVRLSDSQPVAGAQVALFDVTDLRAGAVARTTTDDAGHFAFARKALGGSARPDGFRLGQNYPNPFNPSTLIPYHLPTATHVRLEVFNLLGQRVATLVDGGRAAGAHTAVWDATDAAGQAVGAGVYIYRLSGGGATWTRKMVLIDGQAGMTAGGSGWTTAARPVEMETPVYGLTVSGEGLVPYVDPAFRVEAGMTPVEVVLAAPASAKRLQEETRLLGDVNGDGRVDIVDALLVAASVFDGSTSVGDLDGDGVEDTAHFGEILDLGDVDGDRDVDLIDAYLIGVYSVNPSDPVLPAGIGERVSAASGGTPNAPTKMYWVESYYVLELSEYRGEIYRANLDGSQIDTLFTIKTSLRGLALDVGRGKMYWLAGNINTTTFRANLDGSQVDTLFTTRGRIYDITLDVERGKMYWWKWSGDGIYRANLDGSQVDTLFTASDIVDFALDVGRRKVYWTTEQSDDGRIYRANLDGSQVETLTNRGDPAHIALDVGRRKMYWTTGRRLGDGRIYRANLDGSQVETLFKTLHPSSFVLDVGRGKMYWSDSSQYRRIYRANLDGSQVETLFTLGDPGDRSLSRNPLYIALASLEVSGGSGRPDLIVDSPSVSDSTLTPGQSFTLSTTVRNHSTAGAAATTLRYYRSTDETITTSDTQVGSVQVDELMAWGISPDQSITLNAPSPSNTSTYYYGACVESVSGESNTNNNCSTSIPVTVIAGFDLIVESPVVSESTLTPGQSFTLSTTVRNHSTAGAAATTLRYYRSTDETITTSDTHVGSDQVGALEASGTSAESITLNALSPSSASTYYYGACVESVSGESNTNNNCSTGVRVTVSAGFDLIVESPAVSDSLLTLGQSFTLSTTVRNRSTAGAAATTLRYYRSTDETITTSDTEVGTDAVDELAASGTSAESIWLRIPSSMGMGDYYYGACVEAVTGESDSSNNCSRGVRVSVGLAIAPGERRQYTRTFSADFSYWPLDVIGEREIVSYRVVSSDVDFGLLGVPNVDVDINYRRISHLTGAIEHRATEVRFTYNLSVRSSISLNTTLRARVVYQIVATVTSSPIPGNAGSESVRATYTVPLTIFVRDSGSAKLIAGDAEPAMQGQEQGRLRLLPSSARINRQRSIEQSSDSSP